jgi:hypothetical protein
MTPRLLKRISLIAAEGCGYAFVVLGAIFGGILAGRALGWI